jgi:hypothetical protein
MVIAPEKRTERAAEGEQDTFGRLYRGFYPYQSLNAILQPSFFTMKSQPPGVVYLGFQSSMKS